MAALTAPLVSLENVSKAYATTVVLDGVSLGVAAGERTGVVGRNGGGKTTLLRIISGQEEPDAGRVARTGGLRIECVDQRTDPPGSTVRDAVLAGYGEVHEWAGDAAVREVLGGLGLPRIGLDAPVERLSGGERRRVALAAALVARSDLLVLDEPTNHLDVEGVAWLAEHLKGRPEAVVVVTHDRWFLDEVSEQTWEVGDGTVRRYDGGYSAYVLAKAERARMAAATEQRRQNLMRKELAWLRRGPPARTSKPKFRIEAASALIADEPAARDGVELSRLAAVRLGKTVLDAEGMTVAVGDRVLLRDVSWQLGPGDRVGVVGVNGSGKTSLLEALAGSAPPIAGQVVRGKTVRLGYLTQEPAPVDPDLRALEAAESVRGSVRIGKGELSAGQLLERLGFGADRQWTPVAELSGGERRRLQLQMVLMAEPNVLLLDEPTNDLDIETLTELEDLLDGFGGSIVVVSHDRYFLERVTDHVLALVGEKLAFLPGGVDEYLELVSAGEAGPAERPSGVRPDAVAEADQSAGQSAGPSAARIREAKKELARIDRQVQRLTTKESELHEALAKAATDYTRLVTLGDELKAVQAEKANLEDRWLELAEETSA